MQCPWAVTANKVVHNPHLVQLHCVGVISQQAHDGNLLDNVCTAHSTQRKRRHTEHGIGHDCMGPGTEHVQYRKQA